MITLSSSKTTHLLLCGYELTSPIAVQINTGERMMMDGSCLCGSVTYTVAQEITVIDCCHCLTCRKSHSSAFAMGVTVKAENFQITQGKELISEFKSSVNKARTFCSACGSQLFSYNPGVPENIRLRPALLNVDLNRFEYRHVNTDNSIHMPAF